MDNQSKVDFMEKIQRILILIRWKDWAIDKLPILFMICFYFMLIKEREPSSQVVSFIIFVIFSVSSTIYGYVINNYADLDIDLKQGKVNLLEELSPKNRIILLIGIVIVVILSGLYFIGFEYFKLFWAIQFFIATFYSLPPIRFKEKGLIGLLIPFLAQLFLPVLICASIFGDIYSFETLLFVLYGLFKGAAYDIGHQFHDYIKDSQTETKTFAVSKGPRLVGMLFQGCLVIERIFFLFIIIQLFLLIDLPEYIRVYFPSYIILALYVLSLLILFTTEIKQRKVCDPYYKEIRGFGNILHIIIPNIIFPFYLTIILTLKDLPYIIILLFFFIWVMPTPSKLIWPIKVIFRIGK